MGLLDVVFGRRKMKAPAPDRLFAMATGQVTLTEQMGLKPRGEAAIVFQPLATADFQAIVRDMEEVVSGTSSDAGTQLQSRDDEYGFRWMVLRDDDFEDIVVGINAVSGALVAGGYGSASSPRSSPSSGRAAGRPTGSTTTSAARSIPSCPRPATRPGTPRRS